MQAHVIGIRNPRGGGNGSAGFSLLEVLIALVVLAFGLLGIAAMQTLAIAGSQGGYLRTQATFQAYDIIDRMRANPVGVGNGLYNSIPDSPGSPTTCSTPCTAAQIAANDRYSWNTSNGLVLPNGKGTVTSADSSTFVVTVTWDDRSNQNTGQLTQQLVITVRL